MTQQSIFTVIQLILSIGAGLLVGRYARPVVRKMVTAAMPMQQRLKENFLRRLGLISGLITIGFSMFTAGFVHLSTAKWLRASRTLRQDIKTGSAPAPLDIRPTRPIDDPIRVDGLLDEPDDVQQKRAAVPQLSIAQAADPVFVPTADYLQLEAFGSLENARTSAARWQAQRGTYQVWIVQSPGGTAPWKVVLGPFASLDAARQYRDQSELTGFPRSAKGLALVE
ncbi:SPOR domain-containing protein [Haliscomenobacter hydrossis]|uniref:Sporulation domain-containing protein n=1 Tax=Haliscomenobacter hydrossis (strain ATCC 27775 / DSM 1100 / LMG 10767 / O) TaxID=760192 RepID=F4L2J4_HALH1|nr:SPOR domain-containing protein [Haliscomenobacter hydrossis]AEE53912.1 Sporulation domain-containing protein [Haliscomenobacter hydrossis DSM 1100]